MKSLRYDLRHFLPTEMNMIPEVDWEALVPDTALHLRLFLIGAAIMSVFCTKGFYSEDFITGILWLLFTLKF